MSSEFGSRIGLNLSLLKLIGVIPCGGSWISRFALAHLAFLCLSIYTISYAYHFVTRDAYLHTSLESFTMIISLAGGQARFAVLLLFRDRCEKMLGVCELLWSALNASEKRIVGKYTRKTSGLTWWYLSSCVFTIFFYGVAALFVSSTLNELEDSSEDSRNVSSQMERHLPYKFFVEIQQTPWYEVAYALQVLSMLNVGLTCVGVDTISTLFALIACGHFDVVKSRIERSSMETGTTDEQPWSSPAASMETMATETPSTEQIDYFRVCVTYHRMLLDFLIQRPPDRFCDDLERLTSVMFLTQLVGSTYNISLVGFKLVGDDPDKYKYATQLTVAVIQLFLCNWPADLLYAKSEATGRAAYFSPWYRYPSWLGKPTNLMLMRAQKPARLTAGKFVVLSLETFASMISSAVSFFTVVKSMN